VGPWQSSVLSTLSPESLDFLWNCLDNHTDGSCFLPDCDYVEEIRTKNRRDMYRKFLDGFSGGLTTAEQTVVMACAIQELGASAFESANRVNVKRLAAVKRPRASPEASEDGKKRKKMGS